MGQFGTIVAFLCWIAVAAGSSAHASSIEGRLLSIRDRISIVWLREEFCGSSRMCEGVLYGGAEVAVGDGRIVMLNQLVLLNPETIDCLQWEPYWALLAITEAFGRNRTGTILHHRYAQIEVGEFIAFEVDLTAATDKAVGFAAIGLAYVGEIDLAVKFADPFPENLHLKAFCDETVSGSALISEKRIEFRLQYNRSNNHAIR
jgi:hypothetical protein